MYRFVFFIAAVALGTVPSVGGIIDEIVEQGSANLSAIKSYECFFTTSCSKGFDAGFALECSVQFDGVKYRHEERHTKVPEVQQIGDEIIHPEKQHRIHVFDGERHRTFELTSGEFRVADEATPNLPIVGRSDPLALAYLWVVQLNQNRYWLRRADHEVWRSRLQDAVVLDESIAMNGHECVKLKIRDIMDKTGTRFASQYHVVYFSKEHNYLPIRVENHDGGAVYATEYSSIEEFDLADSRSVYVPKVGRSDPSNKEQFEIVAQSVDINMPIDDAVFVLSPKNATTIVDVDEKIGNRRDARLTWHADTKAEERKRWLIGVAIAAFFVTIVGGAYFLRRRWEG